MRDNQVVELIRLAGEAGAKYAMDTLEQERARHRKDAADWRLRNTKLLLRNYRDLKLHCSITVSDAADLDAGIQNVLKEIWSESEFGYDQLTVDSLRRSVTQTTVLLNHVDDMLYAYKMCCERSKNPEEARKYRVIHAMYIDNKARSVQEIADSESIDARTVYRDIDKACARLSAYFFGAEAILM